MKELFVEIVRDLYARLTSRTFWLFFLSALLLYKYLVVIHFEEQHTMTALKVFLGFNGVNFGGTGIKDIISLLTNMFGNGSASGTSPQKKE